MNQANTFTFLEVFCIIECEMWVTELIFNIVLWLIIPTKCIKYSPPYYYAVSNLLIHLLIY